ncbi:MAG TPA: threonine--tRNA ligase [Bacillota bacterium]|nr:threonine--tRNA ligase [Bacillota bacterium]
MAENRAATESERLEMLRHTASHVLAHAVKRLFPEVKLGIGPAISNGFYYDFQKQTPFTPDDLEHIEAEMARIIEDDLPITRFEASKAEAVRILEGAGETFKMELVNELEGDVASFYKQGDFTDLCRGPHLASTGLVPAFKLTQVAGAYWRGDEKRPMLSRIYGTAFFSKKELDSYLEAVEEAKKRDHNKIGRELGYFTTSELVGQGLPLLMPKGAKVVQILQRFVEDEEERRGYVMTKTPYMAKSDLYKTSGHWAHYKDGMFVMGDEQKGEEVYALRPMTCPFQFIIYNSALRSYRDLPIRYGETSTLFRNESSGEMHGLIRVRQFTISEGHLIVRPDQLADEFRGVVDLAHFMMRSVGLQDDLVYRFSKWDPNNKEKYIDNPAAWEESQARMKEILDSIGIDYYEADGEAAFYGPKLDIQMKNVYGKEDTLITVQIDFVQPDRFDMSYVDSDGTKKRPYVIHRTSVGCYERTLAILIEKYAGALPAWLAPVQVKVLSISDGQSGYAEGVDRKLKALGFRSEVDRSGEKIGYKIRSAQMEKVPYMLVMGGKEEAAGTVAVRSRKGGDMGQMTLEDFCRMLKEETDVRA